MLFLQFVQYSLSFAGTPKNEIPGAALELCQLKIKQFSPDVLKFSTKHEENPFTYYFMVPRTFLFIFHARSRRLSSNNFRNSSYKEKTTGSDRFDRLVFPDNLSVSYDCAKTHILLIGLILTNKLLYFNKLKNLLMKPVLITTAK